MPAAKKDTVAGLPCFADTAAKIANRFASSLVMWQQVHGRHDLPWQQTRDPYRVWLSEIMLQQTQVSTVLNYYPRFLALFPDVQALAAASQDEVLGLWSGLGYYSRARNLHRCAQVVVQEYGGEFPAQMALLMELPGIGRSTAAAIAAFCFDERVSILDGNVKRVLTRTLGYGEDISTTAADRELWTLAQMLAPKPALVRKYQNASMTAMASYTQGLMDLGASLCQPRRTQCDLCPVAQVCRAHQSGTELAYPVKTRKVKRSVHSGYLLWLVSPLGVWLAPRPVRGIWGGLYSMPVFESVQQRTDVINVMGAEQVTELPVFKHVLTHMDWMLQPAMVRLSRRQALNLPTVLQELQGSWFTLQEWPALGLPAPVRRLLEMAQAPQSDLFNP